MSSPIDKSHPHQAFHAHGVSGSVKSKIKLIEQGQGAKEVIRKTLKPDDEIKHAGPQSAPKKLTAAQIHAAEAGAKVAVKQSGQAARQEAYETTKHINIQKMESEGRMLAQPQPPPSASLAEFLTGLSNEKLLKYKKKFDDTEKPRSELIEFPDRTNESIYSKRQVRRAEGELMFIRKYPWPRSEISIQLKEEMKKRGL